MKYAIHLLGLVCLLPIVATARVYKWQDAAGNTVYSQLPPPPEVETETVAPPPPPPQPPEQSLQQLREMDRRLDAARQRRAQEQTKRRQKASRAERLRQQCDQARTSLRELERIPLPLVPDGQGDYRRMPAEEREAELERLRSIITEVCR